MTQNNLGVAWDSLPTGDRGENLQRAIGYYQNATDVYTREAFPHYWAMIQNNLGLAYAARSEAVHREDLGRAAECFRQALTVFTPEAFPHYHDIVVAAVARVQAALRALDTHEAAGAAS
jgi:tetratricopeptide (TPR) repeat protein